VLGADGQGTCAYFGLKNGPDVELTMGTFSKSFASLGGFIAGDRPVIDYIKYNSQAFRFSASMAPSCVGAVRASLKIIRREPERVARLLEISRQIREGVKSHGFKIIEGITPIIPIIIGDDMATFGAWRKLIDRGVFVNAVISPGVPQGQQLLRVSLIATFTQAHVDRIVEAIGQVGRELGLVG
jgi:8-amino-7-oxononanoate synthase